MTTPMTAAQQAQQNNRTNDGKYTTKNHSEAEVSLGNEATHPSTAQRLELARDGWNWAIEDAFASDAFDQDDIDDAQALNPYAVDSADDIVPPWPTDETPALDPDNHQDSPFHRDHITDANRRIQGQVRPAPAAHHADGYEASAIAYDEAIDALHDREMIESDRRDELHEGNPYRQD